MRTRFRLTSLLSVLAFSSVLAGAGQSMAQTQSSANDFPHFRTNLAADLSWWSTSPFGSTVNFVPMVEGKLGSRSSLTVQLPLAFASDGGTTATLGNPGFSIQGLVINDARTRFYIGGATEFPLLALADDNGMNSVAARANIATAFQTTPQWVSQHLLLGLIAGLEHKLDAPIFLRFQMDPFVTIPIADAAEGGIYLRTKFEFEARGSSGFGGGFAVLGSLNSHARDTFQSSADGFFSFYRPSVFFRGGLLLALDNPLGFGFDRGKVATLHASIGIPLD